MVVPWRPAASLPVLHAQLKRGSRAAPPATNANAWGMKGDRQHLLDEQRTGNVSGHNPHDYRFGLQVVTAADFPNAPALGLDAWAVLDDIRRSHDDRVLYGISNGKMFSSYAAHGAPPWAWRYYGGSDGHFDHGHLSVVGDERADNTRPWLTIGATDMELGDSVALPAGAYPAGGKSATVGTILGYMNGRIINIEAAVARMEVATLAGIDPQTFRAELRAAVAAELPGALAGAAQRVLDGLTARRDESDGPVG
jgi:hypothetical protein